MRDGLGKLGTGMLTSRRAAYRVSPMCPVRCVTYALASYRVMRLLWLSPSEDGGHWALSPDEEYSEGIRRMGS